MNTENKIYMNNGIRVYIHEISQGMQIEGEVDNVYLKKPIAFYDFPQFAMAVEKILNDRGFPRANQKIRSFLEEEKQLTESKEPYQTQDALEKRKGNIATVLLYITSRSDVTWQGSLVEPMDGQVHKFQSEIEFLKLWEMKCKNYYEKNKK